MKILALSVLCLFLAACASTPKTDFERDWGHDPVREEMAANDDMLSYLARYMMDAEDRKDLTAKLYKQYATDDALKASLAQYAGYNHFNDSVGMDIATLQAGVSLIADFLDEGSMENISGIALPGEVDGVYIESPEQAWQIATRHSERQLESVARQFDMELICDFGCNEERRIYRLVQKNPARLAQYMYKPVGDIIVVATWTKLERIEKPDIFEAKARGFLPVWSTRPGHMWLTGFYAEPVLDAQGKIQYRKNEQGETYPLANKSLLGVRLGRDMAREYYSDAGFLHAGSDDVYPGYFAFKGTLYSYILRDERRFIIFQLKETP